MMYLIVLVVLIWFFWRPLKAVVYEGSSLADEVSHQGIMDTLGKLKGCRP